MSIAPPLPSDLGADDTPEQLSACDRMPISARQGVILDAFERCMQRSGFHRTTMQDVAREVGMSAGNLYRYFDSKEALVSGLVERERDRFVSDFDRFSEAADFISMLRQLCHAHLVDEPRSRCVQYMEIWAEGTRNPAVGAVCLTIQREVQARLASVLESAKASGQIAQTVDVPSLLTVIMALADGLWKRRAIDPDFDAEVGFRLLFAVMDRLFTGQIDLSVNEQTN